MNSGVFFLVVGNRDDSTHNIWHTTISSNDRIHDREPLAKYNNKMIKAIRKTEQDKWINDRHTITNVFVLIEIIEKTKYGYIILSLRKF